MSYRLRRLRGLGAWPTHACISTNRHIRRLRGAIKELRNYKNSGIDEIHTETELLEERGDGLEVGPGFDSSSRQPQVVAHQH